MSVYLKRLGALAQHLEVLEATPLEKRKRKFDMVAWIERAPCGTAACAMGEACYVPMLKKAGLRLARRRERTYHGYTAGIPFVVRKRKRFYCTEAAKKLFGLTESEANNLFMPNGSINDTPGKVAAQIRLVMKAKAA